VQNPRKQQKRKRCRYEREHSGSPVHGDWHRTTAKHPLEFNDFQPENQKFNKFRTLISFNELKSLKDDKIEPEFEFKKPEIGKINVILKIYKLK
jgi:hypothetical protein